MKVCLLASALAVIFAEPVFAQQLRCDGPQEACQEIARISEQYNALFNKHDVSGITGLLHNGRG